MADLPNPSTPVTNAIVTEILKTSAAVNQLVSKLNKAIKDDAMAFAIGDLALQLSQLTYLGPLDILHVAIGALVDGVPPLQVAGELSSLIDTSNQIRASFHEFDTEEAVNL